MVLDIVGTIGQMTGASYMKSVYDLATSATDAVSKPAHEPLKRLSAIPPTKIPVTKRPSRQPTRQPSAATQKRKRKEQIVIDGIKPPDLPVVTPKEEIAKDETTKEETMKENIPPVQENVSSKQAEPPRVYTKPEDPIETLATPPPPPETAETKKPPPPVYDRTAIPKFPDGRLRQTGPIDGNDLLWGMGVRAFQQATLMGGSMLAGSASGLGPEAGMMLYHTLSSMNKIFDSNNHQSPTDIAAAEGVAVVNDVLFNHGDVEAAASRIKKLRRGSLDAVAGVNDQVIAAFSKGLKTSNSIEQARTSSAAAYRSTFGGV